MNLPGTTDGNWRWRADPKLLTAEPFDQLAKLTETYQRQPAAEESITATS